MITFLRPGFISIKNQNEKKYYVEEGTVEFSDNNLIILTSTAKDLENLDKNLINKLIHDAENLISNSSSDKDQYLASYKINTLKEIN